MPETEIISWLPFIVLLLAAGAIAGLLAGVLGIGGGIVVVPVLFMIFPFMGVDEDIRMRLAVGTSLATIIPTSIMSARTHNLKGGLSWPLLYSILPGVIAGVGMGTYIGSRAKGDTLTFIFATVALLIAAHMMLKKDGWYWKKSLPEGQWFRGPIGMFIGCMSVIMGIGGGTFSVSIFTAFNIPIHRAVGTASAIGLIIALPGAIGYALAGIHQPGLPPFSLGYTNLMGFALIVPTTMLTAPIGARIAHALDPAMLRRLFAAFLFIVSMRMYWSTFGG